MSLTDDIAKLSKAKTRDQARNKKTAGLESQIKSRIINGETTGDPIRDFCIVTGSPAAKKLAYRTLNGLINTLQGEPILVETANIRSGYGHSIGRSGCVAFDFSQNVPELRLGILSEKASFDVKADPFIYLGAPQYASKGNNWSLKEEPLKLTLHDILRMGTPIGSYRGLFLSEDLPQSQVQVYVGETEVAKYFSKTRMDMDLTYVDALNLLGHKAPAEFQVPYDKKIRKEKDRVLATLDSNVSRYCAATWENLDHFDPPATKILIETMLEEALRLKLDVTQDTRTPSPGVTQDVPKYIVGLCKQFGVGQYKKTDTKTA